MRNYTEKTAAAVIVRLLRETAKEGRENLKFTWIDKDGRQCACDGFRAYRLKTPVPGLPDMPENVQPINLEMVYGGPEKNAVKPLDAPSLEDVKSLLLHDKEEPDPNRRGCYFFGPGLPVVSIKYLRDMLQIFPDAVFTWSSTVSALLVKSQYGDGLLLPVRIKSKDGEPVDDSPRPIPGKKKPAAPAFSLAAFAARFAA